MCFAESQGTPQEYCRTAEAAVLQKAIVTCSKFHVFVSRPCFKVRTYSVRKTVGPRSSGGKTCDIRKHTTHAEDDLTSQAVSSLLPPSSPITLPLSPAIRATQLMNSGISSPSNRNPADSQSLFPSSDGNARFLPAILVYS